MPDIVVVIAGVMLAGLTLYALFGGADFGGGVWDLLAWGPRASQQRVLIADAIGPIWEANHVWLILVVVILFTAFPPAFAVIMTALFTPIMIMLIGIVLRGATFTFRSYDSQTDNVQRRWGSIFAITSIVTPIMLGVCAGSLASGRIAVEEGMVISKPIDAWLAPFPWTVGALTVVLFAYLAAVYLTVEADAPALQDDFRMRAIVTCVLVDVIEAVIFVLLDEGAPHIARGLFEHMWAIPLHAGALIASVLAIGSLLTRRFYLARILAGAQVVMIVWGWGVAQFPYLVEPDITIYNAAAPTITLKLMLILLVAGSLFLFPSIYFLLRIFKGEKVRLYAGR